MSRRHAIFGSLRLRIRESFRPAVSARAPSKSWLEPPILLQREFPFSHTHAYNDPHTLSRIRSLHRRDGHLATYLQKTAYIQWSSMGYYRITETISSSSVSAQSKIAAGVFLGIAGGLSRTDSSFANLDWLLASGPP